MEGHKDKKSTEDATIGFIGDDETLAQGYTVIWNYFLNKWCPILGPGPSMLYIQILKRCFKDSNGGQKDDAFPKVSTLCQELGIKSRTTLHSWLNILEDYNFIIRYNRYKTEETGKTLQTSNMYKVRLNIHLIPSEQAKKEEEAKNKSKQGIVLKTSKRKSSAPQIKLLSQTISTQLKCKPTDILKVIKDCNTKVIEEAFKATVAGQERDTNKVYNGLAFFKSTLSNMLNNAQPIEHSQSLNVNSHESYIKRFNKNTL